MSDDENTENESTDTRSPWTIKSVRDATRLMAVKAAKAQGITMADWMDRAVPRQDAVDKSNQVFPPGQPGQAIARLQGEAQREPGKLVVIEAGPDGGQLRSSAPSDINAIEQLAQLAVSLAERRDLPGIGVSARHAAALLRDRLRQARGLEPRAPRRHPAGAPPSLPGGQTAP